MSTQDLQARLDALAAQVDRALSVDDEQGRLLAYSTHAATADRVRVSSILSRHVAPDVLHWQEAHGVGDAVGPVRVPANPQLGMLPRICIPLLADGVRVGSLWVLERDVPLDDASVAALARRAEGVAAALPEPGTDVGGQRATTMAGSPGRRQLVHRILQGSLEAAEDALATLGAQLPDVPVEGLQVAVALPASGARDAVLAFEPEEFRVLQARFRTLPVTPAGLIGTLLAPTHVALLACGRESGSRGLTEAIEHLEGVWRRAGSARVLTFGLGERASYTAGEVRRSYQEAVTAAQVCALDPALPLRLPWADAGVYRALTGARPDQHRELGALADGSAEPLLQTLETYLDLAGNAQRTATALHVHRTTLYYRLGRIRELLGVDLDDGMVRLGLHLALKARRLDRRPEH